MAKTLSMSSFLWKCTFLVISCETWKKVIHWPQRFHTDFVRIMHRNIQWSELDAAESRYCYHLLNDNCEWQNLMSKTEGKKRVMASCSVQLDIAFPRLRESYASAMILFFCVEFWKSFNFVSKYAFQSWYLESNGYKGGCWKHKKEKRNNRCVV